MKKSLLIAGGILLVIAVIIAAVLLSNKKEPVAVIPAPQPTQPVEMCYQYVKKQPSGYSDRALLKMILTGTGGTQVTGEYKNLPAEKDSKVGTFTGTVGPMDPAISARTADVLWNATGEGVTASEPLKIVFGEGSAVALFGGMTNNFQMSQTDCENVDDQMIVEDYLRKNIATIAPKKAVLGGTWYVVSVDINTTTKTGTVKYEDGHVQETSAFGYTRTGNSVVITWK